MTEKRFQVETDEGFVVSLKDNLTKKYPFSLACESVDDYKNVIDEVMSCGVLLNQLWKQTRRFEKHNERLEKENEQLKSENYRLQEEVNRLSKLTCELQDETEWLRNNTVWEQMPSNRKTFTKTEYEG